VDLSQQVRILLKEVEEARGGHVASGEPEVSSSADVATSSQVISQKLVTFRWDAGNSLNIILQKKGKRGFTVCYSFQTLYLCTK